MSKIVSSTFDMTSSVVRLCFRTTGDILLCSGRCAAAIAVRPGSVARCRSRMLPMMKRRSCLPQRKGPDRGPLFFST